MVELVTLGRRQHQPDVAAAEKRERPGVEQELEPERVAIEPDGALDVVHADRDLTDVHDGRRHVVLPAYR